jgi:tetratricopeptide (TPR) repeat protein/peroxiredoxin
MRFHPVAAALWLLLLVWCWPAMADALKGQPAPDFTLRDISGTAYSLSALKSKQMVMLYFFDADSNPSQAGLNALEKLRSKWQGADLAVWAVTQSSPDAVNRFLSRTPIHFPVLMDTAAVSKHYQADRILPTTCILGPDLKVLDLLQGGGKSVEVMLVRLAQRALQHRENEFAQALSEKVVQSDPENVDARTISAYAALNQGRLDESETAFARMAALGGKAHITGTEGLSAVAARKGQVHKALSLARQVEQSDPDRGYVHVIKANVLSGQNNRQAAEKEYQKAIAKKNIQPQQRAEAFNQLGRIRSEQGRLQEAKNLYDQAVEIDPYFIEATANKGLVYEKEGRPDQALACYAEAQRIDGQDLFSSMLQKKLLDMMRLEQDKVEKKRIDTLVQELAARYRDGQAAKREAALDTWTSRPMVLSFVDFTETGGLPVREGLSTVLTLQLTDALNASGRVRVVERAIVEKLLQELNLGSSDLADPATALELGRLLSARLIVTGSLFYLNGNYLLTLRMIDTETTRIAKVMTQQISGNGMAQQEVYRLNRAMLEAVVKQYPLQGYVVQVENDQVMVNLGSGQGVVAGTRFDIVQPAEPVHYRGRQLQANPKVIGQVEIVSVQPDFCMGRVVRASEPVGRDHMLRERRTELNRS